MLTLCFLVAHDPRGSTYWFLIPHTNTTETSSLCNYYWSVLVLSY